MRLTGSNDEYTLETDSGKTITLTGSEAAKLVDVARQIRDRLASEQQEQRYPHIHTIEVKNVTARLDAHHTQTILVFEDIKGTEAAYVLSLAQTTSVRDMLTTKISQMETPQVSGTRQ